MNNPSNQQSSQPTSHDMARNLQRAAEWLLSRPAFEVSAYWTEARLFATFDEKDRFIAAARALGSFKKEYDSYNINLVAKIPGGDIHLQAPRTTVCRLVRPAQYDCDALLSPEEDQALGGAA
jgi:hypothetical protein